MRRVYLILSEADRERLGAPEKLLVKLENVTAREQATLQHAFRYEDTVALSEALAAMYRYDAESNTTYVRRPPEPLLALAWLGLRQAGVLAAKGRTEMAGELDDLDIEVNKLDFEEDEQEKAAMEEMEAAAAGKDSGSTPTRTSTD
jgi:hypothetical protein